MKNLQELAKYIHKNNVEKGFWKTKWSNEHCLCLVISELMEAVEADRKGNYFKEYISYNGDEYLSFCNCIKGTLEEELADAYIRLLDLAYVRNIEIKKDYKEPKFKKSFTENIFKIVTQMTNYKWDISERVNYALFNIETLAKNMNIHLMWFVEHKIQYNKLREYKHGKSY